MRLKAFAVLLAAFLLLPWEGHACISTPEEKRTDFEARDSDKDGLLTLEEYYGVSDATNSIPMERKREHIASVDKDNDGKLNFEEFSSNAQKRC